MFSCIIGPNLELRLHEDRHAEELYQAGQANREHLRPFLSFAEKSTGVDDTRKYIRESLEGFVAGKCLSTGIWENDRFVGGVGLHSIHKHRRYAEMGYWLAKGVEGRGIMTRACSALITHAFDGLKLHRVEIRCDPDNTRSRAIATRWDSPRKACLRESLERYDGVMRDAVVYGLLDHEWKK